MTVEIYTKQTCTFCAKAKEWFRAHGIPFQEIDVSKADDFSRMKQRIPDAATVPQIIIDGHVIGGYDTLMAYEKPILEKLKARQG